MGNKQVSSSCGGSGGSPVSYAVLQETGSPPPARLTPVQQRARSQTYNNGSSPTVDAVRSAMTVNWQRQESTPVMGRVVHSPPMPQTTPPPRAPTPSLLSPEEELWRSILNTTFEVGDKCLEAKIVPLADVAACEPYLYAGLTALTVLHCLRLSMTGPEDALKLSSGFVLRPGDSAVSPETLAVLAAVPEAKRRLRALMQSSEDPAKEWNHLRIWIVTNDMLERRPMAVYPPERVVLHNHVCASIYSLATPLTQMPTFRAKFQNVMNMLAVRQEETTPAVRAPTFHAALIERAMSVGDGLISGGVMRRPTEGTNLQEAVLILATCGVLDYALSSSDASVVALRASLGVSLRRRSLEALFVTAVEGGDEPSVNIARALALDVYGKVRQRLEAFLTRYLLLR